MPSVVLARLKRLWTGWSGGWDHELERGRTLLWGVDGVCSAIVKGVAMRRSRSGMGDIVVVSKVNGEKEWQ